MIFGMQRFLPAYFLPFWGDSNKPNKGNKIELRSERRRLQRKSQGGATNLFKKQMSITNKGGGKENILKDGNNNRSSRKSPFHILKNIWHMKRASSVVRQSSRTKCQNILRHGRSQAGGPKRGVSYRRMACRQCTIQNQKRDRLKIKQSAKPEFAEEGPDMRIINLRRRRVYKSGDRDHETRLRLPVTYLRGETSQSLRKIKVPKVEAIGTTDREAMDDPLNTKKLISSYVRKIRGRPAGPAKSESDTDNKKPRRKGLTTMKRCGKKKGSSKKTSKRGSNRMPRKKEKQS